MQKMVGVIGGSGVVNQPWIHKSFLKDSGKIRSRERYWHLLGEASDGSQTLSTASAALGVFSGCENGRVILPDATCLRKYLRLIKHVLTNQLGPPFLWVLLESVVENMDYRNQAPVVRFDSPCAQCEMAAPQERSTLQQLMREGRILPFCDLSVRRPESFDPSSDEWNWMSFESLTIEERSQHAIVRAARLIQDDRQKDIKRGNVGSNAVVILVDDVSSDGARGGWDTFHLEEGIEVLRLEYFFQSHVKEVEPDQQEQISHLLQSCEQEYQQRNSTTIEKMNEAMNDDTVQEYWSEERVAAGIRTGVAARGRLDFTKENPKEAFVRVDGKHWFINARAGFHNRAMHQDVVVIEPLPEEKWGRPVGKRRLVFAKDGDDDDFMADDLSFPTFPSAKVVAIHSIVRRSFVATMVDTPLSEESAVLLVPMDLRIPKIRVPTRTWQKLIGMRLLVQVDGWDIGSNYPHGHVSEILGPIGGLESEIQCLLCENQVRLDPFSLAASACLPKEGAAWTVASIPDSEMANRRDLRKTHRVFSVDPIGCQDIDDTMHARY